MNNFKVSSISLGRYSLDSANVEKNSQIIAQFYRMLQKFFEGRGIQNWKGILEVETTLDFERILGAK